MKLLMENWRKFLAEEKGFEAHMMFDPKTGDKKQAKTEAEHNELAKKGYVHTDPAKIRKALEDEGGAAGTDAIVDRTDASGEEVKKAMDAMPDVAQHKKGDYILGDKDKIKIEEDCWDGYERVPGSKEGAPGSCRKKTNEESCDDDKEELDERDASMEVWMEKFKLHMRLAQNQPMDEFLKDNAMYAYRRGMDPKQAAEERRRATAERDFPESGMELYDIDEDQIDEA